MIANQGDVMPQSKTKQVLKFSALAAAAEPAEVYENPVQLEDEGDDASADAGSDARTAKAATRGRTGRGADGDPDMTTEKDDVPSTGRSGGSLDNLLRKSKVKQAAILDMNGDIHHVTSGWNLQADDGRKLCQVMTASPTQGLWKVAVFGEDFRCMHCDSEGTILGNSSTKVMVAHVTRSRIIVGLSPLDLQGSCLHEVKQLWTAVESRLDSGLSTE